MTILQAKYRFIQDDVFLVPKVNTETGKQIVEMQKVNLETGEVEFSDAIECIHTAVTDISFEEFEDIQSFPSKMRSLLRKTLEIQSSEEITEINLESEEKFFALKSWVEGIAEAGEGAFKLVNDIEQGGRLWWRMAGRLLLFMTRIDTDYIFDYVRTVERMCVFEGELHRPSLMSNAYLILDLLYLDFSKPCIDDRVKVIRAMHELIEPVGGFPLESVASGANGIIRLYIREHPEYGVRYITHVIERDAPFYKKNRNYLFQDIAPLLIVFVQERMANPHPIYNKHDRDFVNTISELNPPALWVEKFQFSEVLNAMKNNQKFTYQKKWFVRRIRPI